MVIFRNILPYNGRGLYPLKSIMDATSLAMDTSYHGSMMLNVHAIHYAYSLGANVGPNMVYFEEYFTL